MKSVLVVAKLDSLSRRMLVKPDIESATDKHVAPLSCGKMSSKRGIGCLVTRIALLIVFDGSKEILNLSLVSLSDCHVTSPSCGLVLSAYLLFALHFV